MEVIKYLFIAIVVGASILMTGYIVTNVLYYSIKNILKWISKN